MSRPRPYLAAVTAAVLMTTAGIAVTTAAQSQAAPQSCAGVWVVVQQQDGSSATKCATDHNDGLEALTSAGFAATVNGGFVDQIDGKPENTDWTTNGNVWWAFCTATLDGTTGAIEDWESSQLGAGATHPQQGTVTGWRLGKDGACPAATEVPQQATTITSTAPESSGTTTTVTASTSASPTVTETVSTSASPTATATITTSPSTTPTSSPPREDATAAALSAATWLSKNPPKATDADGLWQTIIGLASVNQCSFEPAITSQVAQLKKQVKDYIARNTAGRAGRLATVAVAVGENPRDFGGVDLVKAILDNTAADGQTDGGGNPFSHALALIGLTRTGASVPPAMITALLGAQDGSGAFGFGSGATFFPDLDTTGLAIQALQSFRSDPAVKAAIDKAVAWALTQQTASGQWPNDFAPVNTTGLVGSALDLAGQSSGKAVSWMKSQQLADGGLPDVLGGKEANRFATAEGLLLLGNTSYLTVSFTATCDETATAAPDDNTDDEELPNTGASDATGAMGVLAIVLVAGGGALIALRRSRQS